MRFSSQSQTKNGEHALARLADLMGHASLEVLRRYLHLVTDDLQEIHAQAGPVDRL